MARMFARTRGILTGLAKTGLKTYLNYRATSAALKGYAASQAQAARLKAAQQAEKQQAARRQKAAKLARVRRKKQTLRTQRQTRLVAKQQAVAASRHKKAVKLVTQRRRQQTKAQTKAQQKAQTAYNVRRSRLLSKRKTSHLRRLHRQHKAANRQLMLQQQQAARQTAKLAQAKKAVATKLKLTPANKPHKSPSRTIRPTPAAVLAKTYTQRAKATGKQSQVLRAKSGKQGAAALQAALYRKYSPPKKRTARSRSKTRP